MKKGTLICPWSAGGGTDTILRGLGKQTEQFLGPMAEANLRRVLIISDGSIIDVLTRSMTAGFLIVAVLSLVTLIIRQNKLTKKMAEGQKE